MKSRVTERGQITLPISLRKMKGFRPGIEVSFRLVKGEIVITPIFDQDPIEAWRGKGKENLVSPRMSTDEYLALLRD